jgi:hypothetical protein
MYDFGRIRSGEPVRCTYFFTNTGDATLVINSVQPQCGCTAAGDWSKRVEPGQTGIIPIQFNTTGYSSAVFKQVTVSCNVPGQNMLFLQLKGTIYKPFDFFPPQAVLNIPPDAESSSTVVTITNNTEEPLALFSPESNNRTFTAQLTTNAPGKGYQLTISAPPPLPTGSIQGMINIHTSWTNQPVITVIALANVQPAILVTPPFINLPPAPLVNAITNTVAIENRSTNLLHLSEPIINVPGVSTQIREVQPGSAFTATLIFPQGFQAPPGQPVEMSVKSSNPKFPLVKVQVLQMPRPAPQAPPPIQAAPTPATAPLVKPIVTPAPPPVRPTAVHAANPPPLPPMPPGQ